MVLIGITLIYTTVVLSKGRQWSKVALDIRVSIFLYYMSAVIYIPSCPKAIENWLGYRGNFLLWTAFVGCMHFSHLIFAYHFLEAACLFKIVFKKHSLKMLEELRGRRKILSFVKFSTYVLFAFEMMAFFALSLCLKTDYLAFATVSFTS